MIALARRANGWVKVFCTVVLCISGALSGHAHADAFTSALQQLTDSDFDVKAQAINALRDGQDPRSLPILRTLLDGQLYYRKADRKLVTAREQDGRYVLTDVLNNTAAGSVGKRDIKKIAINNTLRGVLDDAIAQLSLHHSDPAVRRAAVKAMYATLTPASTQLLRAAAASEKNPKVSSAIATALALTDLDSTVPDTRLRAIETLSGDLDQEVRNRLQGLVQPRADTAADETVRGAALHALSSIEARLQLYHLAETVFFGLSLGSVLLLSAIGLAITFGVMGVINMAHGELMMIGAYTTYLIQLVLPGYIETSLLLAIPAAFLVAGLFGVLIERGVIRFLYGRPLETLLATFGISLILQQLVRTTISAQNVTVTTPAWLSGSLALNDALSLTYNRMYILLFALLVFAGLQLILKKTSLGLRVRAVAQNRPMARAMGIRSGWVDALTFGLGSGIAGIAGVALSQLTNVGPNMGQSYIIDSFMVVVFGGVGNLWGTLVGAMSLGVANKFLEPYSGAVLAKIFVLVFIILFIQKRPRGLFPQKGRTAEA